MSKVLQALLLACPLLPMAAWADAPVVVQAVVRVDETGHPSAVDVTVAGGVPPYVGVLQLGRRGEPLESVPLTASLDATTLSGPIPSAFQSGPFVYVVSVQDVDGATADWGTALAPKVWTLAEPPVPEAPPAALPEAPPGPSFHPSATPEPADASMPELTPAAPHPVVKHGVKAKPEQAGDSPTLARPSSKVRPQREVRVFGIPVPPGSQPLLIAGAAASGVVAIVAGLVSVGFIVDLVQVNRMLQVVDRASQRSDPLPSGCASWGECQQPYQRALLVDLGFLAFGVLSTLLLGIVSVSLLLTASALRRE